MTIIKVGPDKVPYHIHKTLLAQHSEYFDRAFKGDSKEAKEGILTLGEIACHTCTSFQVTTSCGFANLKPVNVFVSWLYTRKLPRKCSEWIEYEDWDEINHPGFERAILIVRVFADRYLIPAFGQIVECTFIGYMVNESCPYYETITYAHEHLCAENPILQAMVDSHCYFSGSDSDGDLDGETEARLKHPRRFLINVMERYTNIIKRKDELTLSIHDYHNHSSDEETDACDAAWGDMENDINDETYEATYESDDSCESHKEDNLEDEARDLKDDLKNS